jgi:TPR repeat
MLRLTIVVITFAVLSIPTDMQATDRMHVAANTWTCWTRTDPSPDYPEGVVQVGSCSDLGGGTCSFTAPDGADFNLQCTEVVRSADEQDYADCKQTADLDRAIAACGHIIEAPFQRAADRVSAYLRRGNAHLAKDDLDGGIVDYAEAIKLDPGNVSAYASRALAYYARGDLDRAVADYRAASKLDATKVAAMVAANPDFKEIASAAGRAP